MDHYNWKSTNKDRIMDKGKTIMFKKYKISKLNEQFGIKERHFLFFYKWLTHNKITIHNNVGYTSIEIQTFITINDAVKKVKSLKEI